jgi:16S rRNA (guanine1516-N2)-methyltransferase
MTIERFAVTYGRACRGETVTRAKRWALELQVPYVARPDGISLDSMLQKLQVEALLIATDRGPHVYSRGGDFFYHPGMGILRWKKLFNQQGTSADHFVEAIALQAGQRYLDATLGLAGDALIASHLVGAQGQVMGLEASPLLYFVVSRGLKAYPSRLENLAADLQRIQTVLTDSLNYLRQQPADSFDVVYFDPMFRFPVKAASGMKPLRPLALELPLNLETVEEALRVAPRVVIKERGSKILQQLGCQKFTGGRYSSVVYGIRTRDDSR